MALLHIDGFDHYTNATGSGNRLYERDPENWSFIVQNPTNNPDNTHFVTDTMPELGGRGLRMHWARATVNTAAAQNLMILPKTFSSGETIGIGFYFYMNALPSSDRIGGILGLGGATSTQRSLKLTTSGVLHYWGGNINSIDANDLPGASLVNSGVALSPGVLYHIEWKSLLHASTGTVEVRINGQTILSASGLNTIGSGFTHLKYAIAQEFNSGALSSIQDTNPVFYDNLYMYDATGSLNNNFLGERNVSTVFVNADVAPQDWTLSSGTDAFALLDNVPPSPLTDFIEAENDLDEARFSLADLPAVDLLIAGIRVAPLAYKTGTTDTDIETGISINSNEDTSIFTLTQDQPTYLNKIIEVSPDGGAPLTKTDVENLEVIVKRVDS